MHDRKYKKKDFPKYKLGDVVLFDEMKGDQEDMIYLTQGIIKSAYSYDWSQKAKAEVPEYKETKFAHVYTIDIGKDWIEEVYEGQIVTRLK